MTSNVPNDPPTGEELLATDGQHYDLVRDADGNVQIRRNANAKAKANVLSMLIEASTPEFMEYLKKNISGGSTNDQ